MVGGFSGLMGAIVVGPRRAHGVDRFHPDYKVQGGVFRVAVSGTEVWGLGLCLCVSVCLCALKCFSVCSSTVGITTSKRSGYSFCGLDGGAPP